MTFWMCLLQKVSGFRPLTQQDRAVFERPWPSLKSTFVHKLLTLWTFLALLRNTVNYFRRRSSKWSPSFIFSTCNSSFSPLTWCRDVHLSVVSRLRHHICYRNSNIDFRLGLSIAFQSSHKITYRSCHLALMVPPSSSANFFTFM